MPLWLGWYCCFVGTYVADVGCGKWLNKDDVLDYVVYHDLNKTGDTEYVTDKYARVDNYWYSSGWRSYGQVQVLEKGSKTNPHTVQYVLVALKWRIFHLCKSVSRSGRFHELGFDIHQVIEGGRSGARRLEGQFKYSKTLIPKTKTR